MFHASFTIHNTGIQRYMFGLQNLQQLSENLAGSRLSILVSLDVEFAGGARFCDNSLHYECVAAPLIAIGVD
jgi:hypothetical protein